MKWPWRKKRAKESFASKREREIGRLEGIARQLEVSFGFRPGERQRLIAELAEAEAQLEEAKENQRLLAERVRFVRRAMRNGPSWGPRGSGIVLCRSDHTHTLEAGCWGKKGNP
jgi:hypothetical protein